MDKKLLKAKKHIATKAPKFAHYSASGITKEVVNGLEVFVTKTFTGVVKDDRAFAGNIFRQNPDLSKCTGITMRLEAIN